MNKTLNHQINARNLTTFASIEHELHLNKQKNYLFDLSNLSLLGLSGNSTVDFLQGQLTCDMRLLSDIQMLQGAQCNLKGRILSLLDIINWNGIKLVVPTDLLELTKLSLSKTAQLSRVVINQETELHVYGFYLQNNQDILPEITFLPDNLYSFATSTNCCYYHLGNGFYIFIVNSTIEHDFCAPFISANQMAGSLTWHTLALAHQRFSIYPESRGLFLPHRVDLHQTHYLSFDKGCYKGQEIIARTHYRATLKHEFKTCIINTQEPLYSGQKLMRMNEETELGELIDYSPISPSRYLIAVSILKEAGNNVRLEGHTKSVELETPRL